MLLDGFSYKYIVIQGQIFSLKKPSNLTFYNCRHDNKIFTFLLQQRYKIRNVIICQPINKVIYLHIQSKGH